MTSLVTRIEHLVVPVDDPDDLFATLTGPLGLPPLWPVTDLGPFRSAGVAAGNCWIEIVADAGALTPLYEAVLPATVRGIAFEAREPCAQMTQRLEAAGLDAGPLQTVEGARPDGSRGPLVTALPIAGLAGDGAIAYVCDMAIPVAPARVQQRTVKAAHRQGSPGITGIEEIQIGARDDAAAAAWTKLAGEPRGEAVWSLQSGPRVRVKAAPLDGVAGITATVRSLENAHAALHAAGLLGPVRGSGVGVNHAAVHGLDIWLTESRDD